LNILDEWTDKTSEKRESEARGEKDQKSQDRPVKTSQVREETEKQSEKESAKGAQLFLG
jgi:hypothetical protein